MTRDQFRLTFSLNQSEIRKILATLWHWRLANQDASDNVAFEELSRIVQDWESHRADVFEQLYALAIERVAIQPPAPILLCSNCPGKKHI